MRERIVCCEPGCGFRVEAESVVAQTVMVCHWWNFHPEELTEEQKRMCEELWPKGERAD